MRLHKNGLTSCGNQINVLPFQTFLYDVQYQYQWPHSVTTVCIMPLYTFTLPSGRIWYFL